jgi:hypothetical protein
MFILSLEWGSVHLFDPKKSEIGTKKIKWHLQTFSASGLRAGDAELFKRKLLFTPVRKQNPITLFWVGQRCDIAPKNACDWI